MLCCNPPLHGVHAASLSLGGWNVTDKSVRTLPQLHGCTSIAATLLRSVCLDCLTCGLQTRLGNPAISAGLVGIILVAVFNSTVLAVAVNAR